MIKNNRKKSNRKVKVVGNITPTMDHYPMGGWIVWGDPWSGMS